ncbi:DUF3347 domain-containing protein [Lewinella sp. IMCC34183]|uniref:DUF3347 domain-containing protein n=1 Tax=Lewinella sp. IMCC34183 TaxID=2248762 RepID=UPI0013006213|nr:DUF3347 domain-containing protein [Lewinella sp. IMCC34183]
MKPLTFATLLTLSLATLSCGSGDATENATEVGIETPAQHRESEAAAIDIADAEFTDPLVDKVFQNYLNLRSALVNSDSGEAATAAGNLAETFGSDRRELKQLARQIADTDDLARQREHFSALTGQLGDLIREQLSAGTIYRMHCPMAFDGEGADWYSEVSEIRNPYFGDKMLTCGKVEEEIGG